MIQLLCVGLCDQTIALATANVFAPFVQRLEEACRRRNDRISQTPQKPLCGSVPLQHAGHNDSNDIVYVSLGMFNRQDFILGTVRKLG